MKKCLFLLLLLASGGAFGDAFVYVHTPRLSAPVVVDGEVVVPEGSAWQSAMDVSRIFGPFPEMNVRMEIDGKVTMVEDCTGKAQLCAAMDPRVSPDGKRIVYRKALLNERDCRPVVIGYTGKRLPNYCDYGVKSTELWVYTIETRQKQRITSGYNDITPNWYSNTGVVFSSNRDPIHVNRGYGPEFYRYYFHQGMRIYRMEIGQDPVLITPGEQLAVSPEVMSWGEVCYSSWEGWNWRGKGLSPKNIWWITCTSINGGGVHVRFGAHMVPPFHALKFITDWYGDGGMKDESGFALRPAAEIRRDLVGMGNYYRENPSGFGSGLVCPKQDSEGALTSAEQPWTVGNSKTKGTGQYMPSGCWNPTPYASGQDTSPKLHKITGHPAGRSAYFSAHPGASFLFSHCIGECYKPMVNHLRAFTWKEKTGVVAQKTVRIAKVDMVTDPWDPKQSEQVVCLEDSRPHCWDGRSISTYQERFGLPAPQIAEIRDPYAGQCWANVVDLRATENYKPTTLQQHAPCQIQGCIADDYPEKVAAFMLRKVHFHDTPPPAKTPTSAEGVSGDFRSFTHLSTTAPMSDGSLRVPVPCMVPMQHGGVGPLGGLLAFASKPIWAASGEDLFCHGCHDGASESRMEELKHKTPRERFYTVEAGPGC